MLYLPSYRVQSTGSPPIESNKLFAVENGLLPLNEGVPLHGLLTLKGLGWEDKI